MAVIPAQESDTLVLQSAKNYFLRFGLAEVPEKKKAALGVRGMKLGAEEGLIGAWVLNQEESPVVSLGESGEKEVVLNRLRIGSRDGRGVKR